MLWPLVHGLFPFFENFFESIVYEGIELVWIGLDEVEIEYADIN